MTQARRSNVHLLYGDDEFSIAEALGAIKARLGPAEALGPNTLVLDGGRLSLAELRMVCDTIPFLADHRLVVVEGLLERFERGQARRGRGKGDGKPEAGGWEGLGAYAATAPPSTTLVFTSGKAAPGNMALKSLAGVAQVREFPAMRGAPLAQWVRQRVQQQGGRIAQEAASLLAEFSAGNLRSLNSDVEKLCVYAGGREIAAQDVRDLVSSAQEARIFDLLDAVAQGRQAAAMRILEQLLDQGEAGPTILAMLARQVRMMTQAKSLEAERVAQGEWPAVLGTSSDYAIRKTVEHARACSRTALVRMYHLLLDADVSLKTGTMDETLAIELLVAEMSAGGARGGVRGAR